LSDVQLASAPDDVPPSEGPASDADAASLPASVVAPLELLLEPLPLLEPLLLEPPLLLLDPPLPLSESGSLPPSSGFEPPLLLLLQPPTAVARARDATLPIQRIRVRVTFCMGPSGNE
jgi:hypothetical protein